VAWRHDTGDDGPVTVVAPARERPAATHTKAAVGALNDAGGRKARRDLDARVLAPHVFLSLRREQGEVPVVNAEDREDPAARPADRGDLHDGTVERAGIELEALIALRLDAAKESGRLEVLERLVGESPQLFGMHGALAHCRQQRADTGEIVVRCHITWGAHGHRRDSVRVLAHRRSPAPEG